MTMVTQTAVLLLPKADLGRWLWDLPRGSIRSMSGTRVPFIIRWPAKIKPGVSDAMVNQVDLYTSLLNL